ncbi:33695_t:CDS:1, partial [Gigaspora margarita]
NGSDCEFRNLLKRENQDAKSILEVQKIELSKRQDYCKLNWPRFA